MKKLLLALLLPLGMNAQNLIYSNDFTAGSAGWSLGQGNNFDTWAVNSTYNCSDPTPNQGGGNYLHITDDLNGEYCASGVFMGIGSGGTVYATMSTGINTLGTTTDTLKFDWLCVGQTGPVLASYGTLSYSIDGGGSWIGVTTPVTEYSGQNSWTTATITSAQLPALLNQADLRFRFGFVNSGYGTNPAFAIDNIRLSGDITTSVKNEKINSESISYPNPFSGEVTITNPIIVEGQTKLSLYNSLGQKVNENFYSISFLKNNAIQLHVENLSAG